MLHVSSCKCCFNAWGAYPITLLSCCVNWLVCCICSMYKYIRKTPISCILVLLSFSSLTLGCSITRGSWIIEPIFPYIIFLVTLPIILVSYQCLHVYMSSAIFIITADTSNQYEVIANKLWVWKGFGEVHTKKILSHIINWYWQSCYQSSSRYANVRNHTVQ